MAIEKDTQELIFKAAQRVFQKKGFDGARMQEIADEAQINKSMLHYYYRSKDQLFMAVFQNGVKKIIPQAIKILETDIPLRSKVIRLVGFYFDVFTENPFLPPFVIHEMNQHPDRFKVFMGNMNIQLPEIFIEQINDEIETGKMIDIPPDQFLVNVIGMCVFPLLARKWYRLLFISMTINSVNFWKSEEILFRI